MLQMRLPGKKSKMHNRHNGVVDHQSKIGNPSSQAWKQRVVPARCKRVGLGWVGLVFIVTSNSRD
jgi:hypothetical protein